MTTFPLRLAIPTAVSALALGAVPALADVTLPAPYVSRALDAVLLPIDGDVRAAFSLAADDAGVLVLAAEPGGVADANGVMPGDVLHMIGGQKIGSPVEVDEIVYYWILEGVFDFDLGVYRNGSYLEVISTITEESYWEVIEITTVETWSSWEATSFSYEEYYAEYSEEIVETYESSETLIEETVNSEEFTSEITEEEVSEEISEEEAFEEEASDEVADDGMADDEAMAEDEGTSDDEAAVDEDSDVDAGDEGASDEGDDDASGDEGGDEEG